LNSNPGHFDSFTFISVSFGESHLLVSCVQVAGAAWPAATRIMAGEGDLMQRTRDCRTGQVLGGRVIERSNGAVCGLHRACRDKKCGFLG
jgi:hypothetical protein